MKTKKSASTRSKAATENPYRSGSQIAVLFDRIVAKRSIPLNKLLRGLDSPAAPFERLLRHSKQRRKGVPRIKFDTERQIIKLAA